MSQKHFGFSVSTWPILQKELKDFPTWSVSVMRSCICSHIMEGNSERSVVYYRLKNLVIALNVLDNNLEFKGYVKADILKVIHFV